MTVRPVALVLGICAAAGGAALLARSSTPQTEGTVPPGVDRIVLANPEELPGDFAHVSAVRELAADRVFVFEPLQRGLYVADYFRGTRRAAASFGAGPLEYQGPGTLLHSTTRRAIYRDAPQRRLLYFDSLGHPVASVPYNRAGAARLQDGIPVAVDTLGNVYTMTREFPRSPDPRSAVPMPADSFRIERVDPQSGAPTTLFRVRARDRSLAVEPSGDGSLTVAIRPGDFQPDDLWVPLPDGRVAVLRDGAYQIHFHELDGTWRSGVPVPHEPIPVTPRDIAATRAAAEALVRAHGGQGARVEIAEPAQYPALRAPYASLRASPSGELWVGLNSPGSDSAQRYDVLDSDGTITRRVVLPVGERLVGLGVNRVYTARADSDGLNFIRRYALPARAALRR